MSSRERKNPDAYADVQVALRAVEVEAANFAYRFVKDSRVREDYVNQAKTFCEEVLNEYRAGRLSAKQAAESAHQMRNEIMGMARVRSSDLGRAKAADLKASGLDFDALAEKYTLSKYKASFRKLLPAQQNEIFLEIVKASGRANPRVTVGAARLGAVGRGLWVFSAMIAIYNVGTAEYKGHALGREASNVGGGFAGGAGGGALAGIWFGPVGIAVGVILGGILGALTADQAYIELTGPRQEAVRKFLPRFTHMFHVDEGGIATAMLNELGTDLDAVLAVFLELNRSYSTDVDDVAVLYLARVQKQGRHDLMRGIKGHELRNVLIAVLEAGWTSDDERKLIDVLKSPQSEQKVGKANVPVKAGVGAQVAFS